MPGAQQPQREYTVEANRSVKRYRIVPSLNPNVSAIERALSNAGVIHYMPAERKLIRDRRKTNNWITRRFALLPGYVFVHDVKNWAELEEEVPGVASIVKVDGAPIAIDIVDILELRSMEADSEAEVDREIEQRAALAARVSRTKAKRLFPVGSRIEILNGHAEGRHATVQGMDRGGRVKAIIDRLDALGTISVPITDVKLVSIGYEGTGLDIAAE